MSPDQAFRINEPKYSKCNSFVVLGPDEDLDPLLIDLLDPDPNYIPYYLTDMKRNFREKSSMLCHISLLLPYRSTYLTTYFFSVHKNVQVESGSVINRPTLSGS